MFIDLKILPFRTIKQVMEPYIFSLLSYVQEVMKERLLYAIHEGQGSFDLS